MGNRSPGGLNIECQPVIGSIRAAYVIFANGHTTSDGRGPASGALNSSQRILKESWSKPYPGWHLLAIGGRDHGGPAAKFRTLATRDTQGMDRHDEVGLQLVRRKPPIETIVIDTAEKIPTEIDFFRLPMHTYIHRLRGVKLALAALWFCLNPLAASEHRGVVKFGDLALPGAAVTATQGDKTVTAITDEDGVYSFPDLADGVWTLKVEMMTFAPQTKEVGVTPGAPSPSWDMKLLSPDDMKAITVKVAPSAPSAQTAAAAPANGNAASTAASDANGKKPAKGKGPAAPPQQTGGFQRAEVNAAGAGANQTPVDNIASVDASGASDSMVVNGSVSQGIESRAIGNARKGPGSLYRGDIVGVLDNSVLNARQFSLTGQAAPQPYYNDLRVGGSFGGPLQIPHLLHGNGQFFINYAIMRNRNASNSPNLVPTQAERGGDFSQVLNNLGKVTTILDPTTGIPFPNNMIPASRISPQASALLKFYPLPNFVQTDSYNYEVPLVNVKNENDVVSRINRTLTRKNFLTGGFSYSGSTSTTPSIFNFTDSTDFTGLNANANWRHMFNQRVNSVVGIVYSRASTRLTPYFANRENVSGEAGITGNDQDPLNWGPPTLSFAGSSIASLSDGTASVTKNQTVGLTYQGLWVHRPHNITYGFDIRRQAFNAIAQSNPRGRFTFNGLSSGYDFADFLLGVPDASSIAFGNADKYFRANMDDAYITDDWHVSAGFSVNIGLRWEYGSPITEKYGRLVNVDVLPGFTNEAPVIGYNPVGPLTGNRYPGSLVNPDRHEFSPRLAFAWHPLFGSSIVVYGGYGVYYNTSVYNTIANQMAQQYPLSKSLSVTNTLVNPLTLANGFNATPGVTPNTFGIDPNYLVGYAQIWQLSVQKDVTEGIVMTATYGGTKGTRQTQLFEPNTYAPGEANPCRSCPSGYTYMGSNGNSTLESGQLQLMRRFHNGFSTTVQYTFSKAIDDAVLGGHGQGGSLIANNWLDLSAERGLSNFDQRHKLSVQGQYTTGVGVRGGTLLSGWRGTAFKGWTFTSQINAGTGLPESPNYPAPLGVTGITGIRPDYTGAPLYAAPSGFFLNPAAFTAPVGHWGTAGRNIIIGPTQFSMHSQLARTFKEKFDLRFDATNTLNHVTFSSWNAVITSSQFGLPGPANGMRVLHVNLRWRF